MKVLSQGTAALQGDGLSMFESSSILYNESSFNLNLSGEVVWWSAIAYMRLGRNFGFIILGMGKIVSPGMTYHSGVVGEKAG